MGGSMQGSVLILYFFVTPEADLFVHANRFNFQPYDHFHAASLSLR